MLRLMDLAPPNTILYVSGEWHNAPSRPTPWDEWSWGTQLCSFRSLLPNECLFDIDQPTWHDVITQAQQLEERLRSVACPYYMYGSAGKGIHIHVFLDAGGAEHITSWRQLRIRFWEWATFMGGAADRVKVTWGTFNVVRAEGASRGLRPHNLQELFHRQHAVKSLLETLPSERPTPRSAAYPEHMARFRLPASFLLTLNNEQGLGDCPNCAIPWSEDHVVLDEYSERVECLTCAICRGRQRLAAQQHPLTSEWRFAMPEGWL